LEDRYIHPVTGLAVAGAAALLLYIYKTIIKPSLGRLQECAWESVSGKIDEVRADIEADTGAQRSFFLTVQVLLFAYLSGQYLFAGPVLEGSMMCRVAGPLVLAPIYKPAVPTFWYLAMRVLDQRGSVDNNVWTLALISAFVGPVTLWLLAALMATLPLTFVCYVYLGLAIMSPALLHRVVWPRSGTKFRFQYTPKEYMKLSEEDKVECDAATMLYARLFLGGLVVSIPSAGAFSPSTKAQAIARCCRRWS
jgi:hypothetical protein